MTDQFVLILTAIPQLFSHPIIWVLIAGVLCGGIVWYRHKSQEVVAVPQDDVRTVSVMPQDNRQLIAVIAAAIAASTQQRPDSFTVRSIRALSDPDSLWAQAGRIEKMR